MLFRSQRPEVSNSALLGNDVRADLGLTVTGQVDAGRYTSSSTGMIEITLEALNENGLTNYEIVADPDNSSYYVSGGTAYFTGFVIEQKPLTVNWSYSQTTYNGTAQKPVPTLVVSELCSRNGVKDTVTVSATVDGGNAVNVAEYTAVATLDGSHQGNYYITETVKSHTFNITKRPIDITWNGTVDFNYTYNSAEQSPTPVTADAVFNGDVSKGYVSLATEGMIYCGQHTAYASIINNNQTDNYQISTGDSQAYTISQRTIYVTWDTDDTSFIYAKQSFSPYAEISDSVYLIDFGNGAIAMSVTGNINAGQGLTATAALTRGTSADVTANYILANEISHAYTIEPASLALNWAEGYDSTYIGEAKKPAATIKSGLVDGDRVNVNVSVDGENAVNKNAVNVGTYCATATLSGLNSSNYVISTADQSYHFQITAREVEVTWSDLSLVYNGDAQKPTVAILDTVFQNDTTRSNLSVKIDNEIGYIDSDTYDVTAGLAGDADVIKNYTLSENTNSFVITRLQISFVWGNATFTYDGKPHIPTVYVNDTTFNNDSISIVTTGERTDAGTHTDAAYADIVGDAAKNYVINGNSQHKTITINPMEITVEWDWDSSNPFIYNGQMQVPGASAYGVDNVSVSLSVTGSTGASTSCIATATSADSNYIVSTVDGNNACTYTIAPAPITVSWSNISLTYNGADQKPVANVSSGLIGSDSVSLNVTVGGNSKDVGTYTATAASQNPNYYVVNDEQDFTISPAKITSIRFGDNVTYNGSPQNPNVSSATGLCGSDTVASLNLSFSDKQTDVGKTGITITIGNANYVFDDGNKTKSFSTMPSYISPKTVTVSWTMPADLVYSGSAKTCTATADGAPITLTYYANGNVVSEAINVGTYSVRATTTSDNYTLTGDLEQTFTITPSSIVASWILPESLEYDGASKIYTASYEGEELTITYYVEDSGSWTQINYTPYNVGRYKVVANHPNYTISNGETTFTITAPAEQ